eukprot:Unigene5634_Nuclearia_a/m.17202 Unigene5634_Nuclearia_a/g.17202  ORF Unigene5634_Nuclearia_a/g.17202 Unigene5634_Nuclearia_a/m.17202 type:complete len:397 (+) Unigene5634_Nuclearia_a:100-1290(+)
MLALLGGCTLETPARRRELAEHIDQVRGRVHLVRRKRLARRPDEAREDLPSRRQRQAAEHVLVRAVVAGAEHKPAAREHSQQPQHDLALTDRLGPDLDVLLAHEDLGRDKVLGQEHVEVVQALLGHVRAKLRLGEAVVPRDRAALALDKRARRAVGVRLKDGRDVGFPAKVHAERQVLPARARALEECAVLGAEADGGARRADGRVEKVLVAPRDHKDNVARVGREAVERVEQLGRGLGGVGCAHDGRERPVVVEHEEAPLAAAVRAHGNRAVEPGHLNLQLLGLQVHLVQERRTPERGRVLADVVDQGPVSCCALVRRHGQCRGERRRHALVVPRVDRHSRAEAARRAGKLGQDQRRMRVLLAKHKVVQHQVDALADARQQERVRRRQQCKVLAS